MATIIIENYRKKIDASPVISILNNILRKGLPIAHKCGGRAQCGTCRYRILEGEENVSPIRERERRKLDALGNPGNTRLACQSYTCGDIRIELVVKAGTNDYS